MSQPDPAQRPARKSPSITEYALVMALAATIGVTAVPGPEAAEVDLQGAAQANQLQSAVIEFRSGLIAYRRDHANYPGYEAGFRQSRLRGDIRESVMRDQLEGWTDVWGNASRSWNAQFAYGPYQIYGIPTNPVNGLDTVTMLGDDDALPEEPDGTTGWIYQPRTGELRANCAGEVPVEGTAYFDL